MGDKHDGRLSAGPMSSVPAPPPPPDPTAGRTPPPPGARRPATASNRRSTTISGWVRQPDHLPSSRDVASSSAQHSQSTTVVLARAAHTFARAASRAFSAAAAAFTPPLRISSEGARRRPNSRTRSTAQHPEGPRTPRSCVIKALSLSLPAFFGASENTSQNIDVLLQSWLARFILISISSSGFGRGYRPICSGRAEISHAPEGQGTAAGPPTPRIDVKPAAPARTSTRPPIRSPDFSLLLPRRSIRPSGS